MSESTSAGSTVAPATNTPSGLGSQPGELGPTGRGRTLVVLLHGDRGGSLEQRHLERWQAVGRSLAAADRDVVFMVRPGYRTPLGSSSGWANPYDDDYTAENVARVAGALAALRQTRQATRVVVVGYSGGAAITALLLGRHPGVADAALLLACPCDIPPWRAHRNMQRGGSGRMWTSLNPRAFLSGMELGTPVIAATGTDDDNTLPEFARQWAEQAKAAGARATFETVPDHDHGSILRWDGIAQRLQSLISALQP
jgi:pimeloyl-ACP methyl ester carboxylesterase